MTEDEAKTKWCPHAVAIFERVKIEYGVTYREFSARTDRQVPENGRCIGSACMAWRWNFSPKSQEIVDAIDASFGHPIGSTKRLAESGYCGLAGKPDQ